MVPSALETWATATMRVRGPSSFSYSSRSSSPRSFMGMTRSLAPFSSHSICQGTMLEWCSMAEMTISSPALTFLRPQAAGHQVDAFGGAAHEDQLVLGAGVEEALGLGARLFVGRRGALAQLVHAAMDVGAIHLVELADGVDHRERLLRRGGVIQIHQRLAVDALLQDREILPDLVARRNRPRSTLVSVLMEFLEQDSLQRILQGCEP